MSPQFGNEPNPRIAQPPYEEEAPRIPERDLLVQLLRTIGNPTTLINSGSARETVRSALKERSLKKNELKALVTLLEAYPAKKGMTDGMLDEHNVMMFIAEEAEALANEQENQAS